MNRLLFKKIVKIIFVMLSISISFFNVTKNASASYMPISYIYFINGSYDPKNTGVYKIYYYTSNTWTFTAPLGSKIDSISAGFIEFSGTNHMYFKIDDNIIYENYNNQYNSWFSFPSTYLTNLDATTIEIGPANKIFINGGIVIGLKNNLPDESLVISARDAANAAKTSADNANTNAWTAQQNSWYSGTYGGASESVANIAGYIRNQQLPTVINNTTYNSQSAAYWAYQAAQNATPTISKVQGQNGATCTTGSTFTVVISATPSSGASYRVTCGSFDSGWVSNNTITINRGIVSGANTATVQVKNAAGTTAQTTFTFFKI